MNINSIYLLVLSITCINTNLEAAVPPSGSPIQSCPLVQHLHSLNLHGSQIKRFLYILRKQGINHRMAKPYSPTVSSPVIFYTTQNDIRVSATTHDSQNIYSKLVVRDIYGNIFIQDIQSRYIQIPLITHSSITSQQVISQNCPYYPSR